ncbi:MAG: FRG domain-containing protein [Lachnospiraceae bacterium]|nr:FRG domain-containing protein [Lachnospiraceae bacterium]
MSNIRTFITDIKSRKMYKNLSDCIAESNNDNYPHLTFRVKSVVDYLRIIEVLSKTKYENFVGGEIIYRGMADAEWKLIPSLGRCLDLSIGQEFNLVNSFLALRPEAFQELNTNFEILSKMQHYGLPTRLLDFTTNPLIALFFACNEFVGTKDARVVCHRAFVKVAQNPIIEEICGFYNYFFQEDVWLDDLSISPKKYLQNLYRNEDYRFLIARPFNWNERIRRQAAVFMIFPNKLFDNFGLFVSGGREAYSSRWEDASIKQNLEMVEKEPLKKMYPNAAVRPFDFASRNFYVTHRSIKLLFDYYKENPMGEYIINDWDNLLKKRFQFDSELQNIDLETMKREFCSIIIDKKKKKEILKELYTLGIDESYVYPELQYAAKKIKETYL